MFLCADTICCESDERCSYGSI